jgi:CheY-like chemotaxis protein
VASVRILVVEDFAPFRRLVRTMLRPRKDLTIIGEAVDGLEAVQKARLLKPDLILLDLGLPKQNGITAAKQIVVDSPGSKLLFMSLEASPETVQAAFDAGAQGYIQKLSAEGDLIPAIDALVAGRQFVSGDIDFRITAKEPSHHEVLFYSDDTVFLENGVRFLRDALESDGSAVVIATAAHGQSLVQRLESEGLDVDRAIRQGRYTLLDVGEFLSNVVVNGVPESQAFSSVLGNAVKSALSAGKTEKSRVAIFGECSGALCAEGNFDGAIQMETMGGASFDPRFVDILCTYPESAFERTGGDSVYQTICALHTAVSPVR